MWAKVCNYAKTTPPRLSYLLCRCPIQPGVRNPIIFTLAWPAAKYSCTRGILCLMCILVVTPSPYMLHVSKSGKSGVYIVASDNEVNVRRILHIPPTSVSTITEFVVVSKAICYRKGRPALACTNRLVEGYKLRWVNTVAFIEFLQIISSIASRWKSCIDI